MTVWLWFAPLWVRMVFFGIIFAATQAVIFTVLDIGDGRWGFTTPMIGISAILFGILAALASRKASASFAETVRELPTEQRKVAYRASTRGPIPADPAVRASALQICRLWLQARRKRGHLVVILLSIAAVLQLIAVVNAVVSDAGLGGATLQLVALAGFVVLIWGDRFTMRRYQKREALLAAAV